VTRSPPSAPRWVCAYPRTRPGWWTCGRGSTSSAFTSKWMRKRGTDKWFVYTFIADKPVRELKRKIRALTHRQSQVDLGAALIRINQIQRGWANYFRHAVAKHTFDRLYAFVWWRIVTMVMHRHRMTWTALRRRFKGPTAGDRSSSTGSNCSTSPRCRSPATAGGQPRSRLPGRPRPSNQRHEPCGEPDAVRVARPVRRAAWGNGAGDNPATAPQADSTSTANSPASATSSPPPPCGRHPTL
jgi:Group II intron, maturase-specific domain